MNTKMFFGTWLAGWLFIAIHSKEIQKLCIGGRVVISYVNENNAFKTCLFRSLYLNDIERFVKHMQLKTLNKNQTEMIKKGLSKDSLF